MSAAPSNSEFFLAVQTDKSLENEWKASIGLSGATAIVVGSILGIGIFLTPPIVASYVPNTAWFFAVWLFGGLMAFLGALSYGELGALFPQAGGDYVFLKAAYGRPVAFLFGWIALTATFSGSIATTAVGLGQYYIAPFLGSWFTDPFLTAGPLRISFLTLTAVGIISLFTAINILGISFSTVIQSLVSYTPFAVLIIAAVYFLFTTRSGSMSASVVSSPAIAPTTEGTIGLGALGMAMLPVFFAYSGWNSAAYIGSEIKNARRTLPLALIFGIGLIVILYLLLNSLFIHGAGIESLRSMNNVGLFVAESGFGAAGRTAFTFLTGIAIMGSLNSTILIGPRIYYSMAKDGLLFNTVGTLCPTRKTPRSGLLIQAIWASVLVHLGGFETILNYTTLMIVVLSSLTVGGVFLLRQRLPKRNTFRVPLYPLAPALYIAMSTFLVITLCIENPRQMLSAMLMVVFGLAAYWLFTRRGQQSRHISLQS